MKYRIYCETDSKYEFVDGDTAPTQCPVDAGHTINTDSITVVDNTKLSVTPRQIRLALVAAGHSLATIQAGIDALPEPDKTAATISWEYSTEVFRDNPLLAALAPSLGFTEADLDNLFAAALTL